MDGLQMGIIVMSKLVEEAYVLSSNMMNRCIKYVINRKKAPERCFAAEERQKAATACQWRS